MIFMDQNSVILSWNYPEAFLRKHHRHHHLTDGASSGERMAPVDQWSFDMQFKIKCNKCSENVVFTPSFEYINETKLTMTNLEAFTTYSVQVHAHNGPQYNRIKMRKFLDEFIINENQFYSNGSATPSAAVTAYNYREGEKYITTMIQNKNFSYLMEPLHGVGHGADSDNDLVVVIGNGGAHVVANNFENENFLRLFYKKQQNYFEENQQTTDFASLEITTLAHQLTNYHIDNVRVIRKTNKVVEVQWDRPASLDKKLFQYYEIKWFPRNKGRQQQQQTSVTTVSSNKSGGGGSSGEAKKQKQEQQQQLTSHQEEPQIEKRQTKEEKFTISNLLAETEYGIQVRCKMVNGFGQLSMPVLWVTTQQQQTQMATPVLDDSGQMQTIAWVVVVFVIVVVAGE